MSTYRRAQKSAATSLGALLDLDQQRSAEVVAKLREAYGLKEDELAPMTDQVQRGFFGFGIKPQDGLETAKYLAPTLNTMRISGLEKFKQTQAILGMLASVGLEGSSAGTNYAQMLTRLSDIEPRLAKKSKTAREMKAMLGEHGISMEFYDDKGRFKGSENMLQQLAKLRGLNDLERTRVVQGLFGVEGGRPAQILIDKGMEAYAAAVRTLDNQANLDQRITMRMETFASKLEALSGTITNVMAKIGLQAGEGLKGPMDKANDLLGNVLGPMIDERPDVGTAGLVAGGALGAAAATRIASWGLTKVGLSAAGGMLGAPFVAAGLPFLAAGTAGWAGGSAAGNLLYRNFIEGSAGGDLMGDVMAKLLSPFSSDAADAVASTERGRRMTGLWESLDAAQQARVQVPFMNPDFLSLSQPFVGAGVGGGVPGVNIGEGRLAIDVTVHDDRISTTTAVTKPMSLVRIDGGGTNPAGYLGRP